MEKVYYGTICLLISAGILLIGRASGKKEKQKFLVNYRYYKNAVSRWIRKNTYNQGVQNVLVQSGIPLTVQGYSMIRAVLSLVFLLYGAFEGKGLILMVGIAIFVFTEPKTMIGSIKSPFAHLCSVFSKFRSERIDNETYGLALQLENMSTIKRDKPLGADYILEHLLGYTNEVKSILAEAISLYRLGREDDAYTLYCNKCGTKFSKDFAGILFKLDRINPAELTDQLIMFREALQEDKMTRRMRNANNRSILLTTTSTFAAMVMILNVLIVIMLFSTSMLFLF